MAHLPKIPASAYTLEMDTLGAIPDISVFEGERVPMSRNAFMPGTRPLQLLLLPGSDFPVRHNTEAMRGFQSEDLEIGRLRRHQSRQFGAVARLQMEVDRLRTRLEVEGIPLDFSEEEDDDDGSSSDDAPTPPPSSIEQAAVGPSRRRR
ncbi:hypothetical protein JCGZ_23612 [Jatropha curcas]|uniref:Uncharacterized protein n=1 Tax=Jatropha curcas TaxID=180498 RepID=A0A067L2M0_JATCU|nr:hypothetical protein JCGZ_23612 [Jatropha curcas]